MSAAIASAAIAAVGVGYNIYHGISQNSAANKLKRGLVRPMYPIQPEYYQNQALAENQAQNGLDADAKNYYSDQSDRGLAAGISGTLQGGGDVNNIAALYDKYNQGNRAVATQDSQLKNDNIRYLIDRNKDLAGQQTQQWALNQYEPYKDTASAITALQGAGSQNISKGIGDAAAGASIFARSGTADPSYPYGTPNSNRVIDAGQTPGLGQNPNAPIPVAQPSGLITAPLALPSPTDQDVINTSATQDTLRSYQNSPYYDSLNSYFNQPMSA